MAVKTIDLKEFLASGFLFEINRRVLHPHGLALAADVDLDDAGEVEAVQGFTCVVDSRDDADGFVYADDTFADGLAKWLQYMERDGEARLQERRRRLGFVEQGGDG